VSLVAMRGDLVVSQLDDYINAAFSGLWVQTVEPDEAERELVEHARRQGWTLAVWDIARGLRFPADPNATVPEVNDPLAVLKALPLQRNERGFRAGDPERISQGALPEPIQDDQLPPASCHIALRRSHGEVS
jgi:hypothetical protein